MVSFVAEEPVRLQQAAAFSRELTVVLRDDDSRLRSN